MKAAGTIRAIIRLLGIGAVIIWGFISYWTVVAARSTRPREAKARWLHRTAKLALRPLGLSVSATGALPNNGLLVANHLSYLDIVVLSSLAPCVFVSKSEVRSWPVFGWFAVLSGTLFIQRTQRADVQRLKEQIHHALDDSALVVLFPEATSSDGQSVRPFKSSLLEPVVQEDYPLYVGHLSYELARGDPGRDVCYWGDMILLPHLLNLLTKEWVRARVRVTRIVDRPSERKALARQLHADVLRLAAAPVASQVPA